VRAAAEQCDWNAVLRDVGPFLENALDCKLLSKETMIAAIN